MVKKKCATNRHDFNTCNSEVIGKLSSMASQVGKSRVFGSSGWVNGSSHRGVTTIRNEQGSDLWSQYQFVQEMHNKLAIPVAVIGKPSSNKNTPDPSVKQQQLSGFSIPTVISGCRRDAAARRGRKMEYLTGPLASLLVQRLRSGQNGLVNCLIGRH